MDIQLIDLYSRHSKGTNRLTINEKILVAGMNELTIDSLYWQIEKFHVNEVRKGVTRYIEWKELDEKDMSAVCKALEPESDPAISRSLLRLIMDEADRRMKEGLSVLNGLNENKRLMVQGPPDQLILKGTMVKM